MNEDPRFRLGEDARRGERKLRGSGFQVWDLPKTKAEVHVQPKQWGGLHQWTPWYTDTVVGVVMYIRKSLERQCGRGDRPVSGKSDDGAAFYACNHHRSPNREKVKVKNWERRRVLWSEEPG